jgi:hypothetical protein
VQDAHVLQQ